MAAPSHNWAGMWRHPDDTSRNYNSLEFWTALARTAERGKLDGIFIADVFGIYDVYDDKADAALMAGAQTPSCDPAMAVSAMALVTQNIGFGITANVSVEHPFPFARRFSTLDHFTRGRIGWNIVTGYLRSGAEGMGHGLRDHDDRYELAEDFLEACYKLWEGSWEDKAVVVDRERGIFSHPERVHPIEHQGKYFSVRGRHLSEPSPQRTPLLYQAGTSARGTRFAARHAECVFLNGPTREIAAAAARTLRSAAREWGRASHDIKLFLGANVIVAPTKAEASELLDECRRYLDIQGQLALVSGWTGIDLSELALDDAVPFLKSNAIRSTLENMTVNAPAAVRVRDIAGFSSQGARTPFIVGTPSQVADELLDWAEAADIDGFNLVRLLSPQTLESFVDLVVPELQERGAFKTDYAQGTLREKLFGDGARLKSTHPGALFRHAAT